MKKKYYKTPAFITEKSIQAIFPSITAVASAVAPSALTAASTSQSSLLYGNSNSRTIIKSLLESHHNESTIPALIKVYD